MNRPAPTSRFAGLAAPPPHPITGVRRICAAPDRNSGTLVELPNVGIVKQYCGAVYDDVWQSTACPHDSFGVPFPIECPYRDETLVPA
jgi:hypothetical protein